MANQFANTYDIVETPCYPHMWKVDLRMAHGGYGYSNATYLYHPTVERAMEAIFKFQSVHGEDNIIAGDVIPKNDKRNPYFK